MMKQTFTEILVRISCLTTVTLSALITHAAPSSWQCLCYQELYKGSAVHATTCRENAADCTKLESRVQKGSKTIIAGSLSRTCTEVRGRHPQDTLGGVGKWLPSARPGALWTPSGCLLPAKSSSSKKDALKRGEARCKAIRAKMKWSEQDLEHQCVALSGGGSALVHLKVQYDQDHYPKNGELMIAIKQGGSPWSDTIKLDSSIYPQWEEPIGEAIQIESKRLMFDSQEALYVEVELSEGEDSYSGTTLGLIYLLDRAPRLIFKGYVGESSVNHSLGECYKRVASDFKIPQPGTLVQSIMNTCSKPLQLIKTITHRYE